MDTFYIKWGYILIIKTLSLKFLVHELNNLFNFWSKNIF